MSFRASLKPTSLLFVPLWLLFAVPSVPACNAPGEFLLAIDIGHSPEKSGATSARGRSEYQFNHDLAHLLKQTLDQQRQVQSFIVTANDPEMDLQVRAALASTRNANLLLSLHHDSAQEHYLSSWIYQGREQRYSDKFNGYSIFISKDNGMPEQSRVFADYLGSALRDRGFTPTLHHAENIAGENRLLLDETKGIYRYDELIILRATKIPAALLESGLIINRDEEILLRNPVYQRAIVEAAARAVHEYARLLCTPRVVSSH